MLYIEEKIEQLRSSMIEEANRQGCFFHEKVVAISQELDECLLFYEKMYRQNLRMKQCFTYMRSEKLAKPSIQASVLQ